MRCIIYGLRHDAIVIDCNALRFGTRWSEVFPIITMESSKVNGKIFISAYVAIRSCNLLQLDPSSSPPPIILFPRVFVTRSTSELPFPFQGLEILSEAVERACSLPNFDESIILPCSLSLVRLIHDYVIRKRMEKFDREQSRLSLV